MATTSHASREPSADSAWLLLLAAWLLTATATLGSLFFSAIMELPPCLLCWYQRIFMFPLAIVLLVGLVPFDRRAARYGLPLAVGGGLVAAYHVLLQAGVIPESIVPCSEGVSCADASLVVFGFVSIPVMALAVFALVSILLVLILRSTPR